MFVSVRKRSPGAPSSPPLEHSGVPCTLHCSEYSEHHRNVRCSLFRIQWTPPQCTLFTVQNTVNTAAMYAVHCSEYSEHHRNVRCTLFRIRWTPPQCTLFTVQNTVNYTASYGTEMKCGHLNCTLHFLSQTCTRRGRAAHLQCSVLQNGTVKLSSV